jgi:hypothetical protein
LLSVSVSGGVSEPADTQAPATPEPVDETERYRSLLASGERVIMVRQRHWFTFIQAARWFLLVLGVGILAALLNGEVSDDGTFSFVSDALNWGFLVFVGAGLIGVGWYYLAWRRERYLVTTRRVIEAGGVINKYTHDTALQMINDMLVDHPLMGRILGYGEIDLLTASEAGTNKIRYLPDADGFKKALLDAKYGHEMEVGGGYAPHGASVPGPVAPAPAAASAPAPASDRLSGEEVDSAISHLADLRRRGLITTAEFEEKKKELLDRL